MNATITIKISAEDRKIVSLLADGMTLDKMAAKLKVNRKTLATRIYNLRHEVKCKNSVHLVAFFLRNKFIE